LVILAFVTPSVHSIENIAGAGCAQVPVIKVVLAAPLVTMAINSPDMHLSPELQGNHDIGIPFFLPVIFAFTSGFINGVLNFGAALSFSLQWNLARHFGWLGPGATFAKGVMLAQVRELLL